MRGPVHLVVLLVLLALTAAACGTDPATRTTPRKVAGATGAEAPSSRIPALVSSAAPADPGGGSEEILASEPLALATFLAQGKPPAPADTTETEAAKAALGAAKDADERRDRLHRYAELCVRQMLWRGSANGQTAMKEWRLEATRSFIELANEPSFQAYGRMDEVLWQLSWLLTQADQEARAGAFFKRLIKDYPGSRWLPHAYAAFGDHFYAHQLQEQAMLFYEHAKGAPDAIVRDYAGYRIGWILHQQRELEAALAMFVTIATNAGEDRPFSAREAAKGMVRTYVEIGTADKAPPFFRKTLGPALADPMLERLALSYAAKGDRAASATLLEELIATSPHSTLRPRWEQSLTKLRNDMDGRGSR